MLRVDERRVGRFGRVVPLTGCGLSAGVVRRGDDLEILLLQLLVDLLPAWQIESAASREAADINCKNCRRSSAGDTILPVGGLRMPATVLVVDDDRDLTRLMTKFLKLEGFDAAEAYNGQEALKYLRAGGDASVILLDLRMPVMDGWAFRREQKEDPALADIPVVVLTGIEGDHEQDLGAAATFHKPVSFPDVVDALRRLCEDV
jgi:CheY-like chemotaxis protein